MAMKNQYTLVCDEVRIENNGKFFVIGLYTGPIGIAQIPMHFPLTFLHFIEADRPGRFSAKIRVEHLESGRRLVEGQAQIQVIQPGIVVAPMRVPLQIEKDGVYNFVLELEGERDAIITPFTITLGKLPMMPGMMPGSMPRL